MTAKKDRPAGRGDSAADARAVRAENHDPDGRGVHPVDEEAAAENAEAVDVDVAELRDELDRVNAKWLRALADLDNYRKRVARDRACWNDDARAEFVLPLLDVLDDFERAVSCEATGDPGCERPFREGVEMIFRRLVETLEAQGVRPIPTKGREFDPAVHEAVAQVESPDHASNEIVEEVRKGYRLGERLLRPSRVVVAA